MDSEDDMHDANDAESLDDGYSGDTGVDYSDDAAAAAAAEFINNDSDDIVTSRQQQNYVVLKEADIRQRQEDDITTVSTVLSIPRVDACILLRHHHWSVSNVHEAWFADEDRVRKTVGLLERPVVQFSKAKELNCGICFESYPLDKISNAACRHHFCNACWRAYMSTSIDGGPGCLMLRCPDPSCGAAVGQDMISLLASDDNKEKYDRYLLRSYVEDNRKTKWCPAPGCEYAIEFVVGSGVYDVACLCSYGFCWNCTEEAHRPVDCCTVAKWILKNSAESENMNCLDAHGGDTDDDISDDDNGNGSSKKFKARSPDARGGDNTNDTRSDDSNGNAPSKKFKARSPDARGGDTNDNRSDDDNGNGSSKKFKARRILANTKPCPNCKRPIEKNQGCMHMTCAPPCKFEFCWLCLGAWSDHGERTGDFYSRTFGFYTCNRYETAKQEGAYDETEKRREMTNNSVERYTHYYYYERWATNQSSRQKALADLHQVQTVHLEKLSDKQSQPESQLKFITEAWLQIVECLRVLKWTYAYGYYLPELEHAKRQFFEYLQGEAEAGLERLHQCAEKDLWNYLTSDAPSNDFNDFRTKLSGLTSVTRNYFENLVRALENGLSDVDSQGGCSRAASSKSGVAGKGKGGEGKAASSWTGGPSRNLDDSGS